MIPALGVIPLVRRERCCFQPPRSRFSDVLPLRDRNRGCRSRARRHHEIAHPSRLTRSFSTTMAVLLQLTRPPEATRLRRRYVVSQVVEAPGPCTENKTLRATPHDPLDRD